MVAGALPEVRRCTVGELVDLLASPDAAEQCSLAHGCAALVVEGGADDGPDPALTAAQRRTLEWLPCVSVAPSEGPGWRRFDVVAQPEGADGCAEPGALLAAVRARPQAALALVRLVRAARRSDPHLALWAESVTYGLLQAGPEFAAWRASRPPVAAGAPGRVRVDRGADGVDVVLDRPGRHNALDVGLRDDLVDALSAVAAGDPVPVRLSGEGPSFCSGGDLAEFGTFPDPVAGHVVRSTRMPARAVLALRSRLSAHVHGACVGAGVELAAFAARVVAAPDTTFRLPEVGLGLVPGSGGTWSVPHRIGALRANWLALTGATIPAALARAWGLVDEVSPGTLGG
ncbi:MAG: enoyl-CoA hydratase/isomerase family protein [Acidimicrobiales bacterium]|nr:enoyl-CoA hydratase/isomerase family protein [Acidimicrobiales bacterium]MCB9372142.1 enoyl-CoA hydratase/isomerase family protein [Microthrixaceae bacterium]